MDIISGYNFLFEELTDPRVKDWPLMSNPLKPLIIVVLYLYGVLKIGPKFMNNRKPYNLKRVIQAYNIFQVVSCIIIIYEVATNGWTTKLSMFRCEPVDYSNDPMAVRLAEMCWWTMMLKIAELVETFFFVLRKKYNQVSNLHLYHHFSTFLITWIATKYLAGGLSTFPIMLNCSVHIIMYLYYLVSTFGPKWQKILANWKPKLTILQMVQFCIVILHSSLVFKENCMPAICAYLFIPNVLLVFYMFYDFYQKNYKAKTQ